MPTRSLLALPLIALLASLPRGAHAHELPRGYDLAFETGAATTPMVVTNRGLVTPTSDTWNVRCNEAYGVNTVARPAVLRRAGGTELLVATNAGVLRSRDAGCTFENVSPEPDNTSLAALSAFLAPDSQAGQMWAASGNDPDDNALYLTTDFGDSWTKLTDNEPNEWFNGLAVAPSDASVMYATVGHLNPDSVRVEPAWATSTDGGMHWQGHALDQDLRLVGVHPSQPSVVFAQEQLDDFGRSQLWRSADSGTTFEVVLEANSAFTALIEGPDGGLWLGDKASGLFVSGDDGQSFALDDRWDIVGVQCLERRAGQLWLCATRLPNIDGVWTLNAAGDAWTEQLTFDDVSAPTACEGEAAAVCELPWHDWAAELLPPSASTDAGVPTADAGQPNTDAGVDAGTAWPDAVDASSPPPAAPAKSSGCAAPGAHETASFSWACLFAGLLVIRRGRRAY